MDLEIKPLEAHFKDQGWLNNKDNVLVEVCWLHRDVLPAIFEVTYKFWLIDMIFLQATWVRLRIVYMLSKDGRQYFHTSALVLRRKWW